MKRITRLSIAVLLVGIIALSATGVWASRQFAGTVPPVPPSGESTGSAGVVDMGTSLFTLQDPNSKISVDRVSADSFQYKAPEGKAFLSDIFHVIAQPSTALVTVCFAYPPQLAAKGGTIQRLNEEATPPVWVEVPGAEITDGKICVATTQGYISLIGNQ
jgi:hypothetical protein